MSINQFAPKEAYVGTGLLSTYSFNFKVKSLQHLLVMVTDAAFVQTFKVRGDDVTYLSSVTLLDDGGGQITLASNLPNGSHLFILQANDEPLQESEFRDKSSFTLRRFEDALDVVAGAVQRLAYRAGKAITLPDSVLDSDPFDPSIPVPLVPDTTFFVNGSGTGFYSVSRSDLTGGVGPAGPAGTAGPTGANGLPGADGVDGKSIIYGSGAPGNGTGNNDDFYIDSVASYLYGPKAAGVWPAGTSLIGPAGSGGLITSLAAIGSAPNANAMAVSSGVFSLQPADSTYGGVLTAITQSIKGVKTFIDNLIVSADLTIAGFLSRSTTSSVAAFAGGGQGSATQLTTDINRVTTVTTTNDSVKLPAATVGKKIIVINDGAQSLNVFPQSGEQIDSLGTNSPFPVATTLKNATYICVAAGVWKSQAGGAGGGSSSPLTTKGDVWGFSTLDARLPVGTDGQSIVADSSQALGLKWATPAASSGVNYILNPGAEASTAGWATYKDAAQVLPVDGTGGTANSTWTRSTTTPLHGAGQFIFTHNSGASRQGEGASYDFTIDIGDRTKVMQVEFDYQLVSGTFVAGSTSTDSDLTVYIYDVTNGALIQPSSYKLFSNSTTISNRFIANFQTASNSTSYRLIVHNGTTVTTAFVMAFDDFKCAPCNYVYGTPITDWVAYTPTITGLGTPASQSFYARRVGDSRQVKFALTSGTNTAAPVSFTLPNNETIDSNKIGGSTVVGKYNASATTWNGAIFRGASSTLVYFGADGTAYPSGYNGNNFANATTFGGYFEVPISGWSSSVQMSDGYDGRLIACRVSKNSAQTLVDSTSTTVAFNIVESDSTKSFSTVSGMYMVPTSGEYRISGQVGFAPSASNGRQLYLAIDGAPVKNFGYVFAPSGSAVSVIGGSITQTLIAGQTISLQAFQNSGGNLALNTDAAINWLAIEKLQAPTTMSATAVVAAQYTGTPSGGIGSPHQLVTYPNKGFDTHNAYSGGTYKIPAPGIYDIYASIEVSGTESIGQSVNVAVWKNGSAADFLMLTRAPGPVSNTCAGGSTMLECITGDLIQIRVYTDISSPSYSSGDITPKFSIKRVK